MTNSTVFIIDDDVDLCASLTYLISSINLPTKVFNTPQSYLDFHNNSLQGCLLVDIRMPQMSGLELQRALTIKDNLLPLIFMTGHGDINLAVNAMKQGAFDFITKPFDDQLLLDLILKAVAKDLKRSDGKDVAVYAERLNSFTKREREVMQKLVNGDGNKAIASALEISIKTVELHRANVLRKTQVKSSIELAKIYTMLGKPFEKKAN